ncbi:MAG: tryptophan synthase subunit alpha [Planctomycetota bacterium]
MSAIGDIFKNAKGGVFIPYLTAGYPDPETSIALGREAAAAGADIIELGIPFSDPLADGPVIQASFQAALDAGVDMETCFRVAEGIRAARPVPIVFMPAYNLVLQKGVQAFADRCKGVVDGVIIPDLPPEAVVAERHIFAAAGIDMIFLLAPNTPPARRDLILSACTGYLYCLARIGITGARDALDPGLGAFLAGLRGRTKLPLAVGFGISKPEHVRAVGTAADGFIVGSAIVKLVTEHRGDGTRMRKAVADYVRSMKMAAKETRA